MQPSLRGELLTLRPLKSDDFEALFAVSSDPLIWELHPERTRFQRDVFRKFFDAAMESKGAFAAIDNKTGEMLGSSRFAAYDPLTRTVEVGYSFLSRTVWGKGRNTEMKRLMLSHAFEHVDEVYFFIGSENHRSRRAIEKIGAKLLRTLERQPAEGSLYTATVYVLRKRNFETGPLMNG